MAYNNNYNHNNNYRYTSSISTYQDPVHYTKKISLRDGEDLDSLIARFKRSVKKSGVLEDYHKHDFFLKKSLKRKMKSKLHAQKLKD